MKPPKSKAAKGGLTPAEKAELKALKEGLRDPTEAEAAAILAASESQKRRPARATVSVVKQENQVLSISNSHSDHVGWGRHLAETFGTSSIDATNQSFARISTAVQTKQEPVTQTQANAALALMGAIAPSNELEAAIGEQIVAAHIASLDFLSRARLNAGEFVNTASAYANMSTKLSRTMAMHIEALTKLRTGGRQRIEVVYVNGPAVIGDNTQAVFSGGGAHGGGGSKPDQPHAIAYLAGLAAPCGAPMRREDPERVAVPIASSEGAEALSDARR